MCVVHNASSRGGNVCVVENANSHPANVNANVRANSPKRIVSASVQNAATRDMNVTAQNIYKVNAGVVLRWVNHALRRNSRKTGENVLFLQTQIEN